MVSTLRASEFSREAAWLNTEHPPTLASLKGQVVLLWFWRYSHAASLPLSLLLSELRRRFGPRLTLIGVHAPKFEQEKSLDGLESAAHRFGIDFPVVTDESFWMWRAYGISAWPALVLIDGNGCVAQRSAGALQPDLLVKRIESLLADDSSSGPSRPLLPPEFVERAGLHFPADLLADERSGRLYISDTGGRRILAASFDGRVERVIGSGRPGLVDGSFSEACFSWPGGLARHGNALFAADTLNHAVRRIDLESGCVTTLTGDGCAGHDSGGAHGALQRLNLPQGLTCLRDKLYLTMAGRHQIWELDPQTGKAYSVIGAGLSDLTDGAIRFASLGGPSGITNDGEKLFFSDSEASAVRAASLGDLGRVDVLVGSGMFDFGDADGALATARLQRPVGIAMAEGRLFIADSFNHKVKELDLHEAAVRTIGGSSQAGFSDGAKEARFNEPAGLSYAAGKLYVADTNNHAIRVFDTAAEKWHTLALAFGH